MDEFPANLSTAEIKLLLSIAGKLTEVCDSSAPLRVSVLEEIMQLLKSDGIVSYAHNWKLGTFEDGVCFNVDPSLISVYQGRFQFDNPITPIMIRRKRATILDEIIPRKELEKTELFNEFWVPYGVHLALIGTVRDEIVEGADLRLWRKKAGTTSTKKIAKFSILFLSISRMLLERCRFSSIFEAWKVFGDLVLRI